MSKYSPLRHTVLLSQRHGLYPFSQQVIIREQCKPASVNLWTGITLTLIKPPGASESMSLQPCSTLKSTTLSVTSSCFIFVCIKLNLPNKKPQLNKSLLYTVYVHTVIYFQLHDAFKNFFSLKWCPPRLCWLVVNQYKPEVKPLGQQRWCWRTFTFGTTSKYPCGTY